MFGCNSPLLLAAVVRGDLVIEWQNISARLALLSGSLLRAS